MSNSYGMDLPADNSRERYTNTQQGAEVNVSFVLNLQVSG